MNDVIMEIRQETGCVAHPIQKAAAFFSWDRMAAAERKRILQQAATCRKGISSL